MLQAAPIEDWLNGDWNDAIFEPVPGLIGEPLFGLLVVGTVILAFYVAGDTDLAGPTVVAMLMAALAIPLLSGTAIQWFNAVVIIGFTVAVYRAYRRFAI